MASANKQKTNPVFLSEFGKSGISPAERRFLEDGIKQNIRLDGRECQNYRPLFLETGELPSANGSASVHTSDTDILVGVKCELGAPSPTEPSEGKINIKVDCAASMGLEYGSGGGSEFEEYMSSLLKLLCLSRTLVDRSRLCVAEGSLVWIVFIDVLVINSGGNLLDLLSIALLAALRNTKFPRVQVSPPDIESKSAVPKVEIDERLERGVPFPSDMLPVCVTVGEVCGKLVWDMSIEEEMCAESKVTVTVGKDGKCLGIHKTGRSTMAITSFSIIAKESCRKGELLHRRICDLINAKQTD